MVQDYFQKHQPQNVGDHVGGTGAFEEGGESDHNQGDDESRLEEQNDEMITDILQPIPSARDSIDLEVSNEPTSGGLMEDCDSMEDNDPGHEILIELPENHDIQEGECDDSKFSTSSSIEELMSQLMVFFILF